MKYWIFEKTNFIKDRLFNPLLRRFFEYGVSGLVRENIQNSLDAKLDNIDLPVVVKIKLGEMETKDVPGNSEIEARILSLKYSNQFSKEAIVEMKSHVGIDKCKYISFEDENTKGLSGSTFDDIKTGKSAYVAYAYSKGFHHENENQELERIRGGSHGVGKIASNAASDFNLMFFANCDENNHQTLCGTVELMEHEIEGVAYRATGYFSKEKEEFYIPYSNNFSNIFEKKTRGLKIIIPYVRQSFFDKKLIIQTVCDSFMLAILNGNLEVHINDQIINRDNIESFIFDPNYFEQNSSEIKDFFAPLYFRTYNNLLTDALYIYDIENYYRFKLYFSFDIDITSGRTGIYRTIGMKIEDHKVRSNYTKPYNAILIPYSAKEDEFLKSLENESHTSLDYKHINSSELQANAKRFINDMDNRIAQIVDEKLNSDIPDTEILDTSNIIYEIENKFKKDLEKTFTEVNVGVKNHKKKSVIKVSDTEEPGDSPRDHKGKTDNEFKKPKRVKKQFGEDSKKEYFKISGSDVKRVIYREFESIEIDVTKIIVKGYSSGSLYFSLVDGMGQEHNQEVDLRNEYINAMDLNTNKRAKMSKYGIHNIDFSSSFIKLRLQLKQSANTSLKYKYYLEV